MNTYLFVNKQTNKYGLQTKDELANLLSLN